MQISTKIFYLNPLWITVATLHTIQWKNLQITNGLCIWWLLPTSKPYSGQHYLKRAIVAVCVQHWVVRNMADTVLNKCGNLDGLKRCRAKRHQIARLVDGENTHTRSQGTPSAPFRPWWFICFYWRHLLVFLKARANGALLRCLNEFLVLRLACAHPGGAVHAHALGPPKFLQLTSPGNGAAMTTFDLHSPHPGTLAPNSLDTHTCTLGLAIGGS